MFQTNQDVLAKLEQCDHHWLHLMLLQVLTIIMTSTTSSIATLSHSSTRLQQTTVTVTYPICRSDKSQMVFSVIILGLDSSITSTDAFPYICTAKVTIMIAHHGNDAIHCWSDEFKNWSGSKNKYVNVYCDKIPNNA